VGKSRLFYEFIRSHRTQGWLVLESSSVSYGKASLFLPVIDLLKTYFQVDVRDAARQVREKLTGKLLTLDPALGPTLPAFLALLDVPVEDAAWQALDAQQRRQRTLEAIKRLLLRESQVQPLLLLFEDLHWIDAETQALLDSLLESLPTARILLLVNYRPEYQHGWAHKTYYTQLRIDPLPPERAEALLQALLGDDASVQPLKPLLIQRAEGNPFFLEESVRTLVETQVLAGDQGAYRVARDPGVGAAPRGRPRAGNHRGLPLPDAIQIPATVQAVLAARIDRLPPEEKSLLQAASVIGKDVPFPLLQAIVELPEEGLRRGLSHMQAAEFLYETSLFPELEYTFKHALTYEVAYGSLLQERRRGLHARIVKALETLYPDRLSEQVERLAHHAFRGEVWDKALAYHRQAGLKAVARSAHREAVGCFEQALAALQHLPEGHNTCQQAIDLRFDLRRVLVPLGEYGRIVEYLRTAEDLAHALGDQRRLGRVAIYMADYFWWMGDAHHALDAGKRALGIAADLGDLALHAAAHFSLGQAYYALGDYPQAIDFHRRSVASAEGGGGREHVSERILRAVTSRAWLAWSLAEVGEFPEGIARGEEGVRMAEAVDQPYSLIAAYLGMGVLYLRKGDLHRATPMLERCLSLCQVGHLPVYLPWVAMCLGAAYALAERVSEALPLLSQAVEQATSMNIMGRHLFWAASLCEAHLLAGRTDTAIALARLALNLCHEQQARGHQAWVLRLLGEIALQHDPVDYAQAETSYAQALALADELGMRPLLAHCHLGLGALYRQMGRLEEARAECSTAIDLFRALEMTLWLPRAEAALAQIA
jgi:tetratricopeptide (TPR) repeat protein